MSRSIGIGVHSIHRNPQFALPPSSPISTMTFGETYQYQRCDSMGFQFSHPPCTTKWRTISICAGRYVGIICPVKMQGERFPRSSSFLPSLNLNHFRKVCPDFRCNRCDGPVLASATPVMSSLFTSGRVWSTGHVPRFDRSRTREIDSKGHRLWRP